MIRPAQRRELAVKAVAMKGISIAPACRGFSIGQTCYRYSPKLDEGNEQIADLLVGLTNARKTWGFWLCFLYLRNVQGHVWNPKRVYRIYRDLEPDLRIKPRRRLKREKPGELAVPDDFNREGPGIEVDFSLPAERVVRALNRIIEWRGAPKAIRVDNGPEYVSGRLIERAEGHRAGLYPAGKAAAERLRRAIQPNGQARVAGYDIFESIEEVRQIATERLWSCNNERPNMGNRGMTPARKLRMAA